MTDELKKLAEAAKVARDRCPIAGYFKDDADADAARLFDEAATPDAILALIRERDEAREARKADCQILEGSPHEVMARLAAAEAALSAAQEDVARLRKQVTSSALDALAADGQAHESYAAAMALYERLTAILDWCDLATDQPGTFNGQGVRLLQGPVFDDARKAVAAHAVYAPKEPHNG